MATNYTTNYQLNQWEPTDAVQRVDFNADNAKVDAALKSLSDQVVQKANQSAVNTLITAVNQKADASTVNALSQTVAGKADQSEVDALTAKAGTQLISRTTMSAAAALFSVELSDLLWSEWATVTIRIKPVLPEGGRYAVYFNQSPEVELTWEDATDLFTAVLFPLYDADQQAISLVCPPFNGNSMRPIGANYSAIEELWIKGEGCTFQSGTVIEIWGNK